MAQTKKQAEAAVEAVAKQVTEARETLLRWQTTLAGAREALVAVESESGEELLDDPEKAAQWPARAREARDAVTAAERAVAAQEPRVEAAERAWCQAQADLLEVVEVIPAHQDLARHETRTAELLAALEEHDGPYVPAAQLAAERHRSGALVEGATPRRLPTSTLHRIALARATTRHQVLLAMSRGEDPGAIVATRPYAGSVTEDECYPEVVRPGGLVLAPVFAGRRTALQDLVAELEALPSVLESEIADLEEQVAQGLLPGDVLEQARARRLARIDEVPAELAAARGQLAALVGEAVVS